MRMAKQDQCNVLSSPVFFLLVRACISCHTSALPSPSPLKSHHRASCSSGRDAKLGVVIVGYNTVTAGTIFFCLKTKTPNLSLLCARC